MNETIIRNFNDRVKEDDVVIHNGDFCFKNSKGGKPGEGLPIKASELIKQFKGHWVFVKGNHDNNNSLKTVIERLVIYYGKNRINIVHNPEHADMDCDINFVGHVHQHYKFKRLIRNEKITDLINIGVDQWDFKPVTFEEIWSKYSRWKKENEIPKS